MSSFLSVAIVVVNYRLNSIGESAFVQIQHFDAISVADDAFD